MKRTVIEERTQTTSRRHVVCFLGTVALAPPFSAFAQQQPARPARIGFLIPAYASSYASRVVSGDAVATGLDPELHAKRLELLKEASPGIARVTTLRARSASNHPVAPERGEIVGAQAEHLRVDVTVVLAQQGRAHEVRR